MARLLIHVEGQTEVGFVNEVLREYLASRGYESVAARIVGNARLRGGIRPWPGVRKDLINHLREDPRCFATTMVDYYALPQGDDRGWPGRAQAARLTSDAAEKARHVEMAIQADLAEGMGKNFDSKRFVPFVVMHEFEGLLFSDCAAFSRGICRPELAPKLQEVRNQFSTPEEINDSPLTAPSKRVEAIVKGYEKPLYGVLAAAEIGLAQIRAECPHFAGWLSRLESAARPAGG
jgi:hypothetical protein